MTSLYDNLSSVTLFRIVTRINVHNIFIFMQIFALKLRFHGDLLRRLVNQHTSTWQTACKQQFSF